MELGNNSKQDIISAMHSFKNDINNSPVNDIIYIKYYRMIRFNVNINTKPILDIVNLNIKQ